MKFRFAACVMAAVLLFTAVTACNSQTTGKRSRGSSDRPNTTEETEDPGELGIDPEKALFCSCRCNFAWGYSVSMTYILGNGEVYRFSNGLAFLASRDFQFDPEEKLEYLKQYSDPIGYVDTDYLMEMYKKAYAFDPDTPYESNHVMCDYGQDIVYLAQTDKSDDWVELIVSGDVEYDYDSDIIDDFTALWEDLGDHMDRCDDVPSWSVYTGEFPIISYNCGYISNIFEYYDNTRFVFEDYDSFTSAANYWGLDRDTYSRLEDAGDCLILVMLEDVPTTGYNLVYDGMMIRDDFIFFLPSEDYCTPDPYSTQGDAMDGFITICAYPCFQDVDYFVDNGWSTYTLPGN